MPEATDPKKPLPVEFSEMLTDPDGPVEDESEVTEPDRPSARQEATTVEAKLSPEAALELGHLLVRTAWIDLQLSPHEWVAVLHIAASLGLDLESLQMLSGELRGELPIPAPNFSLLAPHKEKVLEATRRVINADHVLAPVEEEFLSTIALALNKHRG